MSSQTKFSKSEVSFFFQLLMGSNISQGNINNDSKLIDLGLDDNANLLGEEYIISLFGLSLIFKDIYKDYV